MFLQDNGYRLALVQNLSLYGRLPRLARRFEMSGCSIAPLPIRDERKEDRADDLDVSASLIKAFRRRSLESEIDGSEGHLHPLINDDEEDDATADGGATRASAGTMVLESQGDDSTGLRGSQMTFAAAETLERLLSSNSVSLRSARPSRLGARTNPDSVGATNATDSLKINSSFFDVEDDLASAGLGVSTDFNGASHAECAGIGSPFPA